MIAHKAVMSLIWFSISVAVKLREAESNDEMKQLKERIGGMEEINKRLRASPPDHAVAQLQEE